MCYNGYGIGIELFWNGRIKDGRWSNENTGSSHLKERQIISTFVKIRFEFISTLFKSLVRGTDRTKSES